MTDTPTTEAAAAEDAGIPFAEFLENKPPGARVKIADLMINYRFSGGGTGWQLSSPRLELHCGSPGCGGLRYFRYSEGEKKFDADAKAHQTFLKYSCSNCGTSTKMFSIFAVVAKKGDLKGECYKFGEMPAFGPNTPPRLLKMLQHNRDLFMKGRRCESQGLGIAAFVYYRRVVEDQRASIIGEIIRVARLINASADAIAALEAAQAETQFSKSLDMVKDAMPESLRIQGHNPLTLLHDNLSTGLHARTDAECLEIAQAVRVVLAELAERLSNALKDEAELTKALGKLLNKGSPQ